MLYHRRLHHCLAPHALWPWLLLPSGDGLVIHQLTPQPPWVYFEIPGEIGVSIRKERKGMRVLYASFVFQRGSRPPGWGGCQTLLLPTIHQCKVEVLRDKGSLTTPSGRFSGVFRLMRTEKYTDYVTIDVWHYPCSGSTILAHQDKYNATGLPLGRRPGPTWLKAVTSRWCRG